ncbi:MAG TPA: carboxypeptidase-like regulatory domain-containing protein, partial [Bryobacteraceae bacterium]
MKSGWVAAGLLGAAFLGFGQGRGPAGGGRGMAVPAPPGMTGVPGAAAPMRAPITGNGVIEGQVVSAATGAPLKKSNVIVMGMGDRDNPNPTRSNKQTDETGHFSFTNLPPGKYRLVADRQGYLR